MSENRKATNVREQAIGKFQNPYEEFFPKVDLKNNEFLKGVMPVVLTSSVIANSLIFMLFMSVPTFLVTIWSCLTWFFWYKLMKHIEETSNLVTSAKNDREKYEILSDIMARIDKNVLARHGIVLDLSKQKPE